VQRRCNVQRLITILYTQAQKSTHVYYWSANPCLLLLLLPVHNLSTACAAHYRAINAYQKRNDVTTLYLVPRRVWRPSRLTLNNTARVWTNWGTESRCRAEPEANTTLRLERTAPEVAETRRPASRERELRRRSNSYRLQRHRQPARMSHIAQVNSLSVHYAGADDIQWALSDCRTSSTGTGPSRVNVVTVDKLIRLRRLAISSRCFVPPKRKRSLLSDEILLERRRSVNQPRPWTATKLSSGGETARTVVRGLFRTAMWQNEDVKLDSDAVFVRWQEWRDVDWLSHGHSIWRRRGRTCQTMVIDVTGPWERVGVTLVTLS